MSDEKFFKPFRHPIQRLTVPEKDGEHSVRRFAKDASSLASEHLRTMAPEGIDETKTHHDAAKLWGAFRTEDEFQQHESQWLRSFFGGQQRFLDLTFPLGDYMLAPPYDTGWPALFTPHFDGKLVMIGIDGESDSGVGVFLASEVPALVSVTPIGTYKYDAVSFDNYYYPPLRSRGGFGILVYEGGSATPLRVQQATLWNIAGILQFQSITGSGRIFEVNQASAVFGPIPLVPITFNMQPGTQYQVWFWAWMINVFPQPGTAFLSAFSAEVPLISVSAGPPIILH
jgi:hypothetical protein